MNIHDEITIPGQEARYGDVPAWLTDSPVWPAVKGQTGGGQLYLHQAMGLELLGQGHNLAISTGTASGKSLVFQAPTLHHLAANPNATAIAIYPIKALARDQVIRWQSAARALWTLQAEIDKSMEPTPRTWKLEFVKGNYGPRPEPLRLRWNTSAGLRWEVTSETGDDAGNVRYGVDD